MEHGLITLAAARHTVTSCVLLHLLVADFGEGPFVTTIKIKLQSRFFFFKRD